MNPDGVDKQHTSEIEEIEIREWLSSLDYVLKHGSLFSNMNNSESALGE